MKTIAYITLHFKDREIKIAPMELSEEDGSMELIENISLGGTENLKFLKLPTSSSSFIVLNKYHLENSLLEIHLEKIPERKTRRKSTTTE